MSVRRSCGITRTGTDFLRSRIISRIIIRKISRWKGWHRFSGIRRPIFSRMFRKYAEINYKEYIQGIRLEYAYRELISSDTMVEEIAEHSGFADGRAFAKAFRKKYGVRPSDFRKMRKQESEDEKL